MQGGKEMSREIVLFIAASLDGYIAKEDDDLQWLMETEGEEITVIQKCMKRLIQ